MRWSVVLASAAGAVLGVSTILSVACVASPELTHRPDATRSDFEMVCPDSAPPETSPEATFGDLYTQLLSSNGVARCADRSCHGGSAGQAGLSLGSDQRSAYEGLRAYGLIEPELPPVSEGADSETTPENVAVLVNVVSPGRYADGGVRPPRMPPPVCGTRPLHPNEIEQIRRWGRAGAKND